MSASTPSPVAAEWQPRGTGRADTVVPFPGTSPIAAQVARSYAAHIECEQEAVNIPSILGEPDSLDSRRHWQMYDFARPLIEAEPDAQWLTIGDSGADAVAIRRMGASQVISSCISTAHIHYLATRGFLDGIRIEAVNAESIAPLDVPIDYIFCKEAYHHFPRAPIAFYNFLERARRGVVLIEPVDMGGGFPLEMLRTFAKRVLRGDSADHLLFEEWGNFIFRLSVAEMDRMLTSIQVERYFIAYHNDFYHPRLSPRPVTDRIADLVEKLGVGCQNLACKFGLMAYGKVAVVIPTGSLSTEAEQALRQKGFRERLTPRNPFATKADRGD